MLIKNYRLCVFVFTIGIAAAPLLARPADQIRVRTAGYKDMGAAFKSVLDGLRSRNLPPAVAQQAATRISNAARNQYGWFPAGSGPQPGVKTAAKPEIWTRAGDFRRAQDTLAAQAMHFQAAVASGDAARIRTEALKLGGACKQCHDTFRQPEG